MVLFPSLSCRKKLRRRSEAGICRCADGEVESGSLGLSQRCLRRSNESRFTMHSRQNNEHGRRYLLLASGAIGCFLGLASAGFGGGGHGSGLPCVLFLSAWCMLSENVPIVGALLYVAYAQVLILGKRSSRYGLALTCVFVSHYGGILIASLWLAPSLFHDVGDGLAKVWRYMPTLLIASTILFAACQIVVIALYRRTRGDMTIALPKT